MKRLLIVIAGFSVGVALTAGLATVGTAATTKPSSKAVTVTIRHQVRGCHAWSFAGNAFAAAQKGQVAAGSTAMFVDNDVMPHELIQKSGPAVHYTGSRALNHMGASVKVTFPKKGVYAFTTKPGEDYAFAKNIKTIGEDNVLTLKGVAS